MSFFYLTFTILLFNSNINCEVFQNSEFDKYNSNNLISRVKRNIDKKVKNESFNEVLDQTTTTLSPIVFGGPPKVKVKKIIPGNDLFIGNCNEHDKMLYIDNTVITNDGKSILNGTIEIYIDTAKPIKITCFHIYDQIKDGTGGKPSYNSGGVGYNWVKIDVQGQYGKGFHFKTYVFGGPDNTTAPINSSTTSTLVKTPIKV